VRQIVLRGRLEVSPRHLLNV